MHAAESRRRRWLSGSLLALLVVGLAASQGAAQQKQDQKEKDARLSKALSGAILRALGVESAEPEEPAEVVVETAVARPDQPDMEADPAWQPSLKETAVIEVGKGWKPYTVNNFCLAPDGSILAACGGEQIQYVQKKPGEMEVEIYSVNTEIRVFAPDGKLLKTIPVPFKPEALAVMPDGTMFVGGDGRVAKLAPDGKLLAAVDSPTISQAEKEKPKEEKSKPEAKTDRPEKTDAEKKLEAQQQRMAEAQKKAQERFRRAVTGAAVTEKDLFVACPETQGYGYAVWRMDHNLANPVKIVSKLTGCCGQMDIQARNGELWIAENARHRVGRYDRDGKQLGSFGKRDRKSADGFGGCCEPKNVRFTAEGDLLTAESGPPVAVKRFSPEGQFLEVVALPKFTTGCVRVSVAADSEGRVLVLNGGENKIHVFSSPGPAPTHRQVATLTVNGEGGPLQIATFCLDGKGRLLAACTDPARPDAGLIRVMGPDGAKVDEWKLDFAPQAVNVAPDGTVFVGGPGKVARLGPDGKVQAAADSPALEAILPKPEDYLPGGSESPDAKARQLEQYVESMKKSVDRDLGFATGGLDQAIEAAKKKNDAKKVEELTKQKAEFENQMKQSLERNLKQMEESLAEARKEVEKQKQMSPEELKKAAEDWVEQAKEARRGWARVSGVAASDKDLFVCCTSRTGFAVYRMTHDLKEPKRVVDRLSGCCGQMDIQSHGGDLWAAENARDRVVCYDRDGKQLGAWGKRERQGDGLEGFGSCCNPMNIRFGPEGEVYTSEASLGRIKRFDQEGKFQGLTAQVKIVPGCKHVPIAVSPDGNRVYMLDITRSQIAVLQKRGPVKVAAAK